MVAQFWILLRTLFSPTSKATTKELRATLACPAALARQKRFSKIESDVEKAQLITTMVFPLGPSIRDSLNLIGLRRRFPESRLGEAQNSARTYCFTVGFSGVPETSPFGWYLE